MSVKLIMSFMHFDCYVNEDKSPGKLIIAIKKNKVWWIET